MQSATMKAYAQNEYGGPEALTIMEVPKPQPGAHDLLVRVVATAVNPIDCKKRRNFDAPGRPETPLIVGWDAAGVVEAVGSDVTLFKPGDEVYFAGSVIRPGCNAEYTLVDERITGHKPRNLSFLEAAAIPLTALTAWEGLVEGMHIPVPGEDGAPDDVNANKSILVIAGAGGVGSITVQLAKKVLKIGRVVATASRQDSIDYSKKMGADDVVNHREDILPQLEALGLKGVDYVYDTVDVSSNFGALEKVINPLGYFCGITPGPDPIDIKVLMARRVTFVWELMFTRPIYGVDLQKQGDILNRMTRLAEAGVLYHRADNVFEWSQMADAHRLQDSGTAIGKIVLSVKF